MVVNEKQLNLLIACTELDFIKTYIDDLDKVRKTIIGLEIKIDELIEENEDVNDPLDYAMNNNMIKELEKTKKSFLEMKNLLHQQLNNVVNHLKTTNMDKYLIDQLECLAKGEYYVEQSNEISQKKDYVVNYNELLAKNAKTKTKMLGEDYKNIKRR